MTKRRIVNRNNLLLILYLTQIILHVIFSPFTLWISHTDAGSRLSCLSLIAQGAEQVETQAPFPRKSTGKHRTSPDCTVCPICFTPYSGKNIPFASDICMSLKNKTTPARSTRGLEGTALIASPRHTVLKWHIPASSLLPASTKPKDNCWGKS